MARRPDISKTAIEVKEILESVGDRRDLQTEDKETLVGAVNELHNKISGEVEWNDIQNKPDSYPPEHHNHDDSYYTIGEVDAELSGKANVIHTHNDKTDKDDFDAHIADASAHHTVVSNLGFVSAIDNKQIGAMYDMSGDQITTTYAKKTSTYTKAETDSAIASAIGYAIERSY